MAIISQTTINAAPVHVFSALFNPYLKTQWNKEFVLSTVKYPKLENGELGYLKFHEVYHEDSMFRKYEIEMLNILSEEYYSFTSTGDEPAAVIEYTLLESGENTQVVVSAEIAEQSWLSRIMNPKSKKTDRKKVENEIKSLKKYVEENKLHIIQNSLFVNNIY